MVVGAASFVSGADHPSPGSATKGPASKTLKVADSKASYVDQLIEDGWKTAGIKPAKEASPEEYLRRAYLDLLGRIPNVQEARAFLQTRESDRKAKLVSYLLDHPDFAKNFATQWTVLLIGRSNQGRMVNRGALTSWLRKQFASDRPWNEVVHELVSSTGNNRENGAVNFVLAHLEFDAVPLTSRTTRLFLGQQIQCTQCHDHPQNQWKQADFWGINAFFKGMRTEQVTKADATGLGRLRPHGTDGRADRSLRHLRHAVKGSSLASFPSFSTDGRSVKARM